MKKITLLLSLLLISQIIIAQVAKATEPNWLNPIDYSLTPDINFDDLTQGTLTLLYDHQTHIPKQEKYTKFVTKIFENVGIQEASTIDVSYDPTYQTLTFHTINIIRDGKVIDKFNPENFQLLRRETDAENHLYDGSMSAVMNISDVRTGDIVAYSYTIYWF